MAPVSRTGRTAATGEFQLIARLARVLEGSRQEPGVLVGIGDDTAVARRGSAADLYTTDTMVDGVHFRVGQIPWRDLGWKAMAVNLSDIAAMGGAPLYSLVTLGVSLELTQSSLVSMYRGMAEATARFGGGVVGGDVVRSPVLFVTVAMIGTASIVGRKPAVLLRSNARPGDLIAVTGKLGSSGGGLKAMELGLKGRAAGRLIQAHRKPVPRIEEGKKLVAAGICTAMDVSDGLVGDLRKLCEASAVSAVIDLDAIPVSPDLKTVFPHDYSSYALGGGEDYELLFTGSRAAMSRAEKALGPGGATIIGRIVKPKSQGRSEVAVVDRDGRAVAVDRAGWDHLVPGADASTRPE